MDCTMLTQRSNRRGSSQKSALFMTAAQHLATATDEQNEKRGYAKSSRNERTKTLSPYYALNAVPRSPMYIKMTQSTNDAIVDRDMVRPYTQRCDISEHRRRKAQALWDAKVADAMKSRRPNETSTQVLEKLRMARMKEARTYAQKNHDARIEVHKWWAQDPWEKEDSIDEALLLILLKTERDINSTEGVAYIKKR